jgi:iron complex outermembrane recepter protein
MKLTQYSVSLSQISLFILLSTIDPVAAEGISDHAVPFHDRSKVSISARDLLTQPEGRSHNLAQNYQQTLTRVTGVEVKQTDRGLELILQTVAGSERLVPLILPEGNDLVIDILDATLAFAIRNGVEEVNPTEGINKITVNKIDDSSIRVRISGAKNAPSAEIIPGSNLVLSVTSEGAITGQAPDEEIEIIATGEAEEDTYTVPDANTATRTDTLIRDTPVSIQVIPQKVIQDQGITRISDITRNVSGVTATTGPSGVGEEFTVRGFGGNEGVGATVEFRDGFRSVGLGSFNTNNIDRVEVLKGPASVLYGQVEPGGIINFVSKQPLDIPYYFGELEISSFNFYKPSLDISGPLTTDKNLLYRLNIAYENSDSFVDFVDREIFQIAPSLTYRVGDNTRLTFAYEYLSENGTNNPGLPNNPIAFDLPQNLFLGEPEDTVDNEAQSLNFSLEHRFSQNLQLRSRFAWQSASFQRNAFRIGDTLEEDGRSLGRFLQNDLANQNDSYSIQTDLISNFKIGKIDNQVLFGVEWIRLDSVDDSAFASVEAIDIFEPVYDAPRPTLFDDGASTFSSSSDAIGLYLQNQVTLLPNLKLLVGGRYEFIDETSEFQDLDVDGRTPISEVFKDSFSNEAFSPRVGIVYQPIKPVSLYTSYSRSFVPNNTLTITGELIEPTRGTQFEVGVKAEALDGKLAATLAAYQIDRTNVLVVDPVNPDFSIPIGETRSRGIEFDLASEPLLGWNLIASFFVNDTVVTVGDESTPEGDTLINAPGTGASLWTTYEIQTGNWQGFGFGAGIFYVGEVEAQLPNSFQLPDYIRTDATIFYHRDRWNLALNFKNLFDRDYYTNQGSVIYLGDPFTVLGSVSVEF